MSQNLGYKVQVRSRQNPIFAIATLIIGLLLLMIAWGGWYIVDAGDRAIVLRFGQIVQISPPGFHFKIPFMDSVEKISVRTRKMSGKLEVYSKDIQAAELGTSLNYSLNPGEVANIYTKFGMDYEQRIISPQIMAKVKDVFGKYNAVEIVRNREILAAQMLNELQTHFTTTGIMVESVQIENIDFSTEYEKTVEERMKAEVEVEKVRQNLERERINADMVRTKAQGAADAVVMSAKAEAEATILRGEAEAKAIRARAEALAKNSELVNLVQAERWDGKLPATMIPSGTLPIIGTGK